MVKRKFKARGRMSQVVTPEEMAALFEGLREAEDGSDSGDRDSPQENMACGRGSPERRHIASFQNFPNG
jgi:hypothetical protein